jgi:hypothetical protein
MQLVHVDTSYVRGENGIDWHAYFGREDGEIVQVFGFDPRARLDLAETPPTSRQAFEDIGSDQNSVEGECGLEDRRHLGISN